MWKVLQNNTTILREDDYPVGSLQQFEFEFHTHGRCCHLSKDNTFMTDDEA